jgi:hypothetical protein
LTITAAGRKQLGEEISSFDRVLAAIADKEGIEVSDEDLGLGTGGWHVVHWNLARHAWSQQGPGHIMKLRYTSLQVDTGAAEVVTPASAWTGESAWSGGAYLRLGPGARRLAQAVGLAQDLARLS